MAKPPVDSYQTMIKFIQSQLRASIKANYQPVMIKTLLVKGSQTRKQIAEELWKQNNKSKEISHYLTVPVYRVLLAHQVVSKQGDVFSLTLKNYSETEKQLLIDKLDSWISRSTTFLKTGFLPLKEAKEKARELAKQHNLKTPKDWEEFVKSGKKPANLPSNPSQYYKKRNSGKN